MKNQLLIKAKDRFVDSFFDKTIANSFFKNKLQNTVVMYHGVASKKKNAFNSRHMWVETFKKHLLYFKKECNVISLSDFHQQKFDKNKINIALTFDDGYLNNYTVAKPILEEMKVPATFFITGLNEINDAVLWADYLDIASHLYTQNIVIDDEEFKNTDGVYYSVKSNERLSFIIKQKKADYDFKLKMKKAFAGSAAYFMKENLFEYWKLMTDEQIKATGKSDFVEIGSHGYYHNNLGTIHVNESEKELIKSKTYLENLTQKQVSTLSYPDGSYSRELVGIAERLGFKTQVAAEGYLFTEDAADVRIIDRKGIYNIGNANIQLFNALKSK